MKRAVFAIIFAIMAFSCQQAEVDTTGNFFTYYNYRTECEVIANETLQGNLSDSGLWHSYLHLWIAPEGKSSKLYFDSDFSFTGRNEWKNKYKRTIRCTIGNFELRNDEPSNNGVHCYLTSDMIDLLYSTAQTTGELTVYLMPETGDDIGEKHCFTLTDKVKLAIIKTIDRYKEELLK